MKKPHLSIRTTLLVIIGILNILIAILVGKGVYTSWMNFRQAQSIQYGSVVINALYDANKNLSLERAAAMSVIYASPETAEFMQEDLLKYRQESEAALALAFSRLEDTEAEAARAKYQALQKLRGGLDDALQQPAGARDPAISDHMFKASTALISEIQNFILVYSRSYQGNDAAISRERMFKYFVWELAEFTGEQYAIIGRIIAENKRPTAVQQQELMTMDGRIQYGWEILHKYAVRDDVAHALLPFTDEAQTQYFLTFGQIKDLFYGLRPDAEEEASYPLSVEMWLGIAAQTVDSLLVLQTEVSTAVQKRVELMEENSRREMLASAAVFFCALMLSFYCLSIIVFRVAKPVNAMVNALYRATQEEIYEMPKILHQHDEIGKLARVLEVFQDNAQKMKQSNEELERFAYIAAHDLKSPLRAVDNISQWLEEDLGDSLDEKDKKYMEELRNRVRLMDRMLDDTLEYARIGAKMEEEEGEIVSGKTLMEDIVALLAPPPDFTIKIGDELSRMSLQKLPLQQVLYNLVTNALKHHNRPEGLIEIEATRNESGYIFTVRDDGPGIAPQYHQKIFEMFQTLQPRDKSKGRGMGLAVVRKIITANGGKIEVKSEPGKGAVFRFTWPKSEMKGENNADNRRRYA